MKFKISDKHITQNVATWYFYTYPNSKFSNVLASLQCPGILFFDDFGDKVLGMVRALCLQSCPDGSADTGGLGRGIYAGIIDHANSDIVTCFLER